MKIVFMGSPEFSVPVLDAIVESGHEVVCVYCQPPRAAGRGKKTRVTPVHKRAEELGLMVRHPLNFKNEQDVAEFAQLNADIAVVVAYGLLLPQAILDAPVNGCVNIHASLLPRWRGAAPIHRAILAGDTQTGVCIMQMEAGLDTGPVLLTEATDITPDDTTQSLHDRLSEIGASAICNALSQYSALTPVMQPNEGVTYASKIDKTEAKIDWSRSADEIDRQIRGLSPFPGAWTTHNGERFKFLHSRVVHSGEGAQLPQGRCFNGFKIQCGGGGAVEILRVQREGRKALPSEEVLKGLDMSQEIIFGEDV